MRSVSLGGALAVFKTVMRVVLLVWVGLGCGLSPETQATREDKTGRWVAPLMAGHRWGPTRPLPMARNKHTATLLLDGKVLVTGGLRTGSLPLDSTEVYDPATGTWSPTGFLIKERASHTATRLLDGKVLVTGGEDSIGWLTSAEVYDPALGMWSTTGSLGTPRYGHTATLLPDGKVLVAGGSNSSGRLDSAEVYDPGTGMWSTTDSLDTPRDGHTATRLPDGKVLVAGGDSSSGRLDSAEVYDPGTGTWSPTGSLSIPRYWHTATSLSDGKVLVAGGSGSISWLTSAEVYDPGTGMWSPTGSLDTPRDGHTATPLPDGRVLVTGGNGITGWLDSAEVYDPDMGTWGPMDALATARDGHTATLLLDGRVLVTGGSGLDGRLASAEVYRPGVATFSSPLAERRTGSMVVLLPNGWVLVAGGSGTSGSLASVELRDPVNGLWTRTASMSTPRSSSTATLLLTGEVLVAGGLGQGGSSLWAMGTDQALSSAELFNPETGEWRSTGSLNEPRHSHSALLLSTGKVMLTGGVGVNGQPLSSVELYDPATGTWRKSLPMSKARQRPMVVQLPTGKVLVAGGLDEHGDSLASVELYDPVQEMWTETAEMKAARAHSIATLLHTGEVLVAGGANGSQILSSTEVYHPGEQRWAVVGPLSKARKFHEAQLLPTGRVLVLGGSSGVSPLDEVEVYDPVRKNWQVSSRLLKPSEDSTTVLLPTGQVLVIAGKDAGGPLSGTELYDALWDTTRPVVKPVPPQKRGASLDLEGNGFRGITGNPGIVRLLLRPGGELRDLTARELSDTSVQVTLSDVPDGYHLLFVLADDMAGGQVVHVDGTPPGAPRVTGPSEFVRTPQPAVIGTAEPGSTVNVLLDGQPAGTATADHMGDWHLTLATVLDEGKTYELTSTATDGVGNTSAPSEAYNLSLDATAPREPEVTWPQEDAFINAPRPNLKGKAEQGSTVTVSVSVDGKEIEAPADMDGELWIFTVPTELGDGPHAVSVKATDPAGNVSQPSVRNFTVDTRKPEAPEILAPQDGTTVTTHTPVLSGTAEPDSTVSVFLDDDDEPVGTISVDTKGNWSGTLPMMLKDGTYSLKAEVMDAAGNISSVPALVRFTVSGAIDVDDVIVVGGGAFGCAAGSGHPSSWLLGLTVLGWLLSRRRLDKA